MYISIGKHPVELYGLKPYPTTLHIGITEVGVYVIGAGPTWSP